MLIIWEPLLVDGALKGDAISSWSRCRLSWGSWSQTALSEATLRVTAGERAYELEKMWILWKQQVVDSALPNDATSDHRKMRKCAGDKPQTILVD